MSPLVVVTFAVKISGAFALSAEGFRSETGFL
jgi:hypothetical protein